MKVLAMSKQGKANIDIVELAERYYEDVVAFCIRRVGYDRAGDMAQETFLTAQRIAGKFQGKSTVKTWLLGIANNHCREECRRHGREILADPEVFELPDNGPELVERVVLEEAILKLTLEHREVVVLHELDGLTYDEISGVLGVPSGTVKSRLHHAFVHLRKNLGVSVPA